MTPPAGRIVGNYALGTLIGRGGMSEVYAATHRFLGDAVAIKLLRAELVTDDDANAAFVAEATRTRAIAHPAVVRVLDFGRDDASGCCYLVMERVDGENLAARLRRVGRLAEDEVRRLGAELADGMAAAHRRGIVHRDLKPANVMMRGDQPTIVDFGIARQLGDRTAVTTGRRIGTPAYMAPEQLTGGLVAPCVDIWALGVILFEASTGRLPFDGFDDGRCPQLFEPAPRAGVSAEFDDLLSRCLAREPGQRPASMELVAQSLREPTAERITQDVAAPLPLPLPLPSTRGRRSWPILAGIAAAAIAIGVIAVTLMPASGSTTTPPPDARPLDARIEADAARVDAAVPIDAAAAKPKAKPKRPRPKDKRPSQGETLD